MPTPQLRFYTALLGLEQAGTMGEMDYRLLKVGDTEVAGVMQITPDMGPVPPNWMVYFAVDDVDATVAKAQSLGAQRPWCLEWISRMFGTFSRP